MAPMVGRPGRRLQRPTSPRREAEGGAGVGEEAPGFGDQRAEGAAARPEPPATTRRLSAVLERTTIEVDTCEVETITRRR